MNDDVAKVLERYPDAGRDSLIPILQEVQEALGYLSKDAVLEIARHLNLPASKIYGVATFYNQFRFRAPGKHVVQVCRGTACHVKGSAKVLTAVERALGIEAGQTTRDGMFSLEVVVCIGVCGLAPVIRVDDDYHAQVTPDSIRKILAAYRRMDKEVANG
ncbi:MAG: NADH-quinone oxidoreductase subunit NuoE [Candidatus Lernaella stagnicola]|nr:NADH-quinone oxidoreductase subunit NuoE [Candidatus Lernaella stagnicola]